MRPGSHIVRPDLLFLSPIMPFAAKSGLSLRAGHLIEAAARHFRVHLYIVPVAGGPTVPPDRVAASVERVGILNLAAALDTHAGLIGRVSDPDERRHQVAAYSRPWLSRGCTPAAERQVLAWLGNTVPVTLLAMRLYLAPLAGMLLEKATRPVGLLDLDEDDALTFIRIAALHRQEGDNAAADAAEAEARKFAALARGVLPQFDGVTVCSEQDAARLAAEHPAARLSVLPNICDVPPALPRRRPVGARLRLIFVGNLSYPPNADAVRQMVVNILPALRGEGIDAELDIIGPGDPGVSSDDPDVRLRGAVSDLSPYYAQADIALVPLRAGGGTRLKILEAFAHGVPVVASDIGAEGLEITNGVQYVRANLTAEFAAACRRLHDRPELANHLAENAWRFVVDRHSRDTLGRRFADLLDRARRLP